jgi:hypothetical protein
MSVAQDAPAPSPQHHHAPWNSEVSTTRSIHLGGATIQIDFAPGSLDLPQDNVVQWIQNAATAVTTYYGRFPVATARVLVVPAPDRSGVLRGTSWGGVGGAAAFTRMVLGQHTTQQELKDDWTMTHEFVHSAFPSLPDDNHWMEEGLATYVEPIARVQAGFLTPEKIWGDMVRDMSKGEPGPGDEGLDQTHTWGRTYWGGAMFCLVADVTIREKTGNRKGLQDALRAIVNAGGTIDKNWDLPRALAIGDQATGFTVLTDLYSKWGKTPVPVDLDQLWNRLGIRQLQGQITFDDHAPLAAVRRKITAPLL